MDKSKFELMIYDSEKNQLVTLVEFDSVLYNKFKKQAYSDKRMVVKNIILKLYKPTLILFFLTLGLNFLFVYYFSKLVGYDFLSILLSDSFRIISFISFICFLTALIATFMFKSINIFKVFNNTIKTEILNYYHIHKFNDKIDSVFLVKDSTIVG